jgi:DNA-directed RNA polymerase specialized sigma24 family protein
MDRIKWVDERIKGWALWVFGGSSGGSGPAVYNENRVDQTADVRAGLRNTDPAFNAAALETDRAIAALPTDLRRAVIAAYTWDGGTRVIAGTLGVTRATLHRRLCNADRRVAEWFEARKRRSSELSNNLNYATYT